ncbi:MAG: VWA domain-containing protein [Planctomycetes bacterium]|nr:VWA domain-containing protein [Planctomycetota bacterium]
MSFLIPPWWPVVLLLPLAAWIGHRRQRRRRDFARHALGRRQGGFVGRPVAQWLRIASHLGCLVAVAIALLQPVAGDEAGEPAGPDVLWCIDVSWSMAAQDVPPSRLQQAVKQLGALADRAPGARFGLLVFAGEARLAVPLTADLDAVRVMARGLAAGAELRGGTDLGAAVDQAAAALRRGGAAAGSIVLLTDGEDFGGKGRAAAMRAREAGLIVDCVGYGTAVGSKIAIETERGQQFLRDAGGEHVISVLDRVALAELAAAGGGRYATGSDVTALAELYDGQLQPRAAAAAREDGRRRVAHRFQWPLFVALLLWMLALAMQERCR